MIFSSYFFLLVFLPITIGGYLLLRRWRAGQVAIAWMVIASLVFYAWKTPPHLVLLLGSASLNFLLGRLMTREGVADASRIWGLRLGVTANLLLIMVFKYLGLLWGTATLAGVPDFGWSIVLPIGISFFTFQQIAYLVDVYREKKPCERFLDYLFFVAFFPQLIAGPIVHHSEILPQLARQRRTRLRARHLSVGSTMLVIGLFKKVVLADQFALFATPLFQLSEQGRDISWLAAWIAATAFSLQLYFDFSGYSDMAIGMARLIGIRLPANFDSPYRATSIVDFWHRWHITLSRFLRDYLYFPLGGNRKGKARRYVNLMITMLLGGLWHGASWTFVAWGGVHGLLLCLNHGWRWICGRRQVGIWQSNVLLRVAAMLLTFFVVTISWVFFRSESFAGAAHMLQAMSGFDGFDLDCEIVNRREAAIWIIVGLAIVWGLPNSQTLLRRFRPAITYLRNDPCALKPPPVLRLQWRPKVGWAIVIAMMAIAALVMLDRPSEFIYYQF